jgi:ATP-binding cassette subfamily B protein
MKPDHIESVGIARLLRNLYRYIRPYRLHLVPVILACILEMMFSAQGPLSMRFLIDRALGQHDRRILILVLVALGSGAAIVSVAGLGRDYLYARVVMRTIADMRYKMFAQLQSLSIDFYARTEVGDVLSRFSSDLTTVNEVLIYAVGWGVQPGLDLILTTALVFAFEWKLALVGVLICPVCVLGPRILAGRATRASSEKQSHESGLLSSLQENVSAPALIRAYNLQEKFLGSFFTRNRALMNAGVKLGFLSSAMDRSSSFGTLILQVIVNAHSATAR